MSNAKSLLVTTCSLAGIVAIAWAALNRGDESTAPSTSPAAAATPATQQSMTAEIAAATAPLSEREQAYQDALRRAATEEAFKDWPASPEVLAGDFFQAASSQDFDRLLVLCPGSTLGDYVWYEQFPPSPAKAVGAPEPHPIVAGVKLVPVKVAFPGFPNKTVKLAMRKAEDGRLIIDGEHTIWW